ncbi:MAG TPA: enoyl-CoA hydratase/isomerase family protein [Trebonia sp.]|jgi:enoyl-CoA hydratase/carnithine racemase
MTEPTVLVSSHGSFGRIELSRPAKRNALDNASALVISQALADFAEDPGCRGIVLCGTGGNLCSGADLKDPSNVAPGMVSPRMALLADLSRCPLPVVAVVDGWAVGLGVAMAAACYATVVTSRARFRLPEASTGIFPTDLTAYLAARMRPRDVADLILTGRDVDAQEALHTGLATAQAEPETAQAVALGILESVTRPARAVVAQTLAWLAREENRGGNHAD